MTTHILSIPFKRRFDGPMRDGIKTRTWRTRKYGSPGERFARGGQEYELTIVERAVMGSVPAYWREEGFNSPDDAIETLKEIFPENGYEPDRMGWAHWFRKIGP
jgi:hypothetical protein